jgi:copper chaperone CopZ
MAVEKTLEVEGMTCTGCENTLRRSLRRLDGVILANPDHRAGEVTVRFDDARVSEEEIKARIRAAGYEAP